MADESTWPDEMVMLMQMKCNVINVGQNYGMTIVPI